MSRVKPFPLPLLDPAHQRRRAYPDVSRPHGDGGQFAAAAQLACPPLGYAEQLGNLGHRKQPVALLYLGGPPVAGRHLMEPEQDPGLGLGQETG